MDEEKETKEDSKDDTKKDSGDGDDDKVISELDRADSIVERQKRENDRRESLLEREEKLQALKMVGGESEAGKPSKQSESKEEIESKARVQRIGEAAGAEWAKKKPTEKL